MDYVQFSARQGPSDPAGLIPGARDEEHLNSGHHDARLEVVGSLMHSPVVEPETLCWRAWAKSVSTR